LTVTVMQRLAAMARDAQLKRYDQAIASLTPDRLIARCGRPAEDLTREVFPVVLRTVRYRPMIGDPLVLTFSRTDEQQSDWYFDHDRPIRRQELRYARRQNQRLLLLGL